MMRWFLFFYYQKLHIIVHVSFSGCWLKGEEEKKREKSLLAKAPLVYFNFAYYFITLQLILYAMFHVDI